MKTTTNKRRYAIRDIKEKNQRRAPRLPFLLALIILSIYLSPTVPAQETLITEDDKVRPSDGPLGFEFGLSIALENNILAVGAPQGDTDNCSPAASCTGAVYIFQRNPAGDWSEVQKLTSSDAEPNDAFGSSVSINGGILVVGAIHEDGSCFGVCNRGAAYVFEKNEQGSWNEIQKIAPRDLEDFDSFGKSISLKGDDLAIGAPFHDAVGPNAGAVYIYKHLDQMDWVEVRKITADDADFGDVFGSAVAIEKDILLVGAKSQGQGSSRRGAAYFFKRSPEGIWLQKQKLLAGDNVGEEKNFGESISLDGNSLVVGAPLDSESPVCQGDVKCKKGSVYFFERAATDVWTQSQKIMASDAESNDNFGISVAIQEDRILVGSYLDDDACPSSPSCNSGSAYVFERNPEGTWEEARKLTASDAASARGLFGISVDLDQHTLAIGARRANAAYVFSSPQSSPDPRPIISIQERIAASFGAATTIQVAFSSGGHILSSTIFSIDFDQTCLEFNPVDANGDGTPDEIHFTVPGDFSNSVTFSAEDNLGELDFSIADFMPPLSGLPDGLLVNINFTPICLPASTSIITPLNFSTSPVPLFGDSQGQEVVGAGINGSVEILPGIPGDCNGDGAVGAGDISACVLEVFDGDGNVWTDVASGTFLGSPVGCDANQDLLVNAGDFSCKALLIFEGSGTCGPTALQSTFAQAPASSTPPELRIGTAFGSEAGQEITIPLSFKGHGHAITAGAFSLDFDETCLSFDPTDSDANGMPDSISFTLPTGINPSVSFNASATTGQLGISFLDPTLPFSTLPDGVVATLTVTTQCDPDGSTAIDAAIRVGAEPPLSFGDTDGQSVPGTHLDGGVSISGPIFTDGFESGGVSAWSSQVP